MSCLLKYEKYNRKIDKYYMDMETVPKRSI